MSAVSFPFTHNGMEYIIWAWKGDYINLGAGAELGIYFGGGPHWFTSKSLSLPMSVSLDFSGIPDMYNSFYGTYNGCPGWSFNNNSHTAVFVF